MTSQDPRAVWSQTTGHILLHPLDMLGSGGEGSVYRLQNHPELVAKVYHRDKLTGDTINKLEVMIGYPPRTEDEQTGHVFVSWPKDTVHDTQQGPVVGFLMPVVDKTNGLYDYYNPASRRRNAPHVNYANLCSAAESLAAALDRLHGLNYTYIVGDINESNAYITENEHVTLIDADSFQVTDSRTTPPTIYRCTVGKPEYTPPELQGLSFADIDRNIHHDNFALAVVIYQLLMEGTHPFRGIYTDPGEKPQVEACISRGYFLHSASAGQNVPLLPPRAALPWDSLPERLRRLFHRCFDEGHSNPARRPDPREWEDALDEAIQDLEQCAQNPSHWYFGGQASASGSAACTWCERKATLGIEAYPQHPESRHYVPPGAQPPGQTASPVVPPPSGPPSNTIPPAPPSPPSTGGSVPASGSDGGRSPLWLMVIGVIVVIFWGGPGSARPLWLRLLGVITFLWIGWVLFGITMDGINAFEERFIWPLLASEAPPPAAVVAAPPPTDTPTPPTSTPMPPTSTPGPLHTSTPTTGVAYTPVPPNTPVAAVVVPTNTPIPTSAPTYTPTPTDTPTPRPTFTPSPTSTATHTPSPTATHTPLPTSTSTPLPTLTPTPSHTPTHTPLPTSTHTPAPCKPEILGSSLNRCDLSGADLRGYDLTGVDLRYANLAGTNLKDAVLTGANLTDANLAKTNFEGAVLAGATIAGASVEGVILIRVNLSSTDISGIESFKGAKLQRAVFPSAVDLAGVAFVDADLSHSSLVEANLESADFTGASLYRADLTRAILKDATFRKANLKDTTLNGANLQGAGLAGVDFKEFSFNNPPDFRGADLRNTNFFKAELNSVNFSGANLEEADFDEAEMVGTIFDNAHLQDATMKDAELRNAIFNNADVRDVDFNDSNLIGASFRGADIDGTKFRGSDLSSADFSGAHNAGKAVFDETTCSDGVRSDNCYSEGRLHGIRP